MIHNGQFVTGRAAGIFSAEGMEALGKGWLRVLRINSPDNALGGA
jgi:hypothetical protein